MGFGVFGAGALIIGLAVLPLVHAIPGDRERRVQWIIHQTFRLWVWFATTLRLFRVQWNGVERLCAHSPCIVVANHPTLIDIVLLISRMPQADCVVKSAAWRNPFLRWIVRPAGYIPNDAGAALLEACVSRVRGGRWLLLFPEGTRSPAHQLGAFRRGAAHAALRSGAPLLPIVIVCDPPALTRGRKWYDVPERMIQFTIDVAEPIPVPSAASESSILDSRRLTDQLRALYEERLAHAYA